MIRDPLIPPPPVYNDANDFTWHEFHRQMRDAVVTPDQTYLEILDTTTSITLPTTPTIFKPANLVNSTNIDYDIATGEITFKKNGVYTLVLLLNALASSSNKKVYFYAESRTVDGWELRPYSGRARGLQNNVQDQINIASTNYWKVGNKVRILLWASDVGVTLTTNALPGTSTVYVPATRLMLG